MDNVKEFNKEELQKILFYDPHYLESYNSLFNFIIGERGKGKTYYYSKKRPIQRFLDTGEQFIYLRRYKNELKTIGAFFDDIIHENEFPDHVLEVKGKTFYCDGKVMGFAVVLSTANMLKSTSYPKVQSIVYDEFLIPKIGHIRYLPLEVETFLNFYETVARLRPNVKAFFIGNAMNLINPYFTTFHIMPNTSTRFTSVKRSIREGNKGRQLIIVEILQDDKVIEKNAISFREKKKDTDFYEITQELDYSKQSNDNIFLDESDDFIKKKTSEAKFLYTLVYMGNVYGIWVDGDEGEFYVSYKRDVNTTRVYALTTDDFKVNMFLVDNLNNYGALITLKKAFTNGYLMFENHTIKDTMFTIMKLLGC